ncbi:AAA family ATPase [Candidatus Avelusimicrobium faecicola]|uniref:AAA family ATPase n=1 Tax=Candidatus Avelusimicrobium faecicola TaxID=3416205 RepID=UPI00206FAA8E|nr:MAG TPA: RecF protein [Caudoviricetes sp.]
MTNGIISLTVENIKKIKAVTIRPQGNMVEITGRNGQGKSTVLDAIWWALKGKDNIQTAPIRNGEPSGKITLELDKYLIERTFRRNELGDDYTTKITVTTKDRAQMRSPQAVLDGFTGMLGFDPLAFMRQTPRQQYDTLRGLCKLSVDVEELDRQYKDLFAHRTEVNRDVKTCEARLANMVIPPNAPTERVDVAALVDKVEEINAKNASIAQRQRVRQTLLAENVRRGEEAKKLQARLSEIEKENKASAEQIGEITDYLRENKPQDTAFYSEKIKQAEQINAVMDLRDNRALEEKTLRAAQKTADELTAQMQGLQEQKRAAIESAKLPVSGLEFGEGDLLLKGVPLAQLSAAEQLKLSMDIAMAENPKLRVLLLKDASLLDSESLDYVRQRAEAEGYQVWAERVAADGAVGFVIEDGELKQEEK